ncbi:MAG: diacylglycerol kinase family lipid kinase [Dehalococcoidia bacterium]|nr:MAG: diacylglycerol kinase family lipid kinase [Dehalococcoidia bacterium]
MSLPQAKVIVNPVAGASTTYRKWPKISSLLRRIGLPFEFQYTEGVGHAIELAREAANNGCQFLVAVGGDGTVHEVANGILLSEDLNEATIGIISTGTGGDFIRSAGIDRDYIKACSSLTGVKRRLVDVGIVEYYKDGQQHKRFFVNSSGVGFDAAVAETSNQLPKFLGGTIPYIVGLLKSLLGYKNKSVTISMNHRTETKRILSVVVANGCYFGGGMRVAPLAYIDDGLLDVISVGDMGKLELLRAFPTIYRGTHINHPKVEIAKTTQVKIESAERFLVHADGEFLGEGPVSFGLIPSALSVAV